MVIDFIEKFCINNKYNFEKDFKGNIYVTKGEAQYYPCVAAHMDTVHKDQIELVDKYFSLNILEVIDGGLTFLRAINPVSGTPTGIGGDDKCGVYICLELLKKIDNIKAVFFVEEECGMLGSKNLSQGFFKDVGYLLQFDAPTKNWFSYSCSGTPLWSKEFFDNVSPVLKEHSIDNISIDPFTDVVQVRKYFDFCCAVLPTGYYNQHTKEEFVIEEHTLECVEIGKKFIDCLGENKYIFKETEFLVNDYKNPEYYLYEDDILYKEEEFNEMI